MKFEDFIGASKCLTMTITVEEYVSIRHLLCDFYSAKDLEYIDDFCRYAPPYERFLLCNPHCRNDIRTPMMLLSAVTFVNRIAFSSIAFKGAV